MNFAAICLAILVSLGFCQSILATDRSFVPVASYLDRPEVVKKDGKRCIAILNTRKVTNSLGDRILDEATWAKWTAIHGKGSAVIFVPKNESAEARLQLARAIKAEGLRVTLRDDSGTTMALESILTPPRKP